MFLGANNEKQFVNAILISSIFSGKFAKRLGSSSLFRNYNTVLLFFAFVMLIMGPSATGLSQIFNFHAKQQRCDTSKRPRYLAYYIVFMNISFYVLHKCSHIAYKHFCYKLSWCFDLYLFIVKNSM